VYEHEMAFARGLADRAAEIGTSVYEGDIQVSIKQDLSPVTQADTEIERMIREQIASAFPDDHVLGEEQGGDASAGGRVWIVDPIDATANFARRIPIWATLIALRVGGEFVLGLANAPMIHERYEAVRGAGATCNGTPIKVSEIGEIEEAQILHAEIEDWLKPPRSEAVLSVLVEARRARGFGDFWGHMLVSRGAAEASIEPALSIWDYAALAVIVEEAGGRVTTMDGGPLRHGGSVMSSNAAIHDELVRRISAGV
jgi:histidinol-phosphatase